MSKGTMLEWIYMIYVCVCTKNEKKCEMNKEKWPSRIFVCVCTNWTLFFLIRSFSIFQSILYWKESNNKKSSKSKIIVYGQCVLIIIIILPKSRCCCCFVVVVYHQSAWLEFCSLKWIHCCCWCLVLVLDFHFSSIDSISQLSSSSSSCLTTMWLFG